MKKFSLFLFVLTFYFLVNAMHDIDSLGKQAAVAFVQQEGLTLEHITEWVKDFQNTYYIDTLRPEIKQALVLAIIKKFGASLDLLFPRVLIGHTDRVTAVAFSKSGNYIVTGSRDKTAKLWHRSTGKLLSTLDDTTEITAVALSDDENFLVTGSTVVKVWCVKTGQLKVVLPSGPQVIHSIKISADNRYVSVVYKNEHDHEEVWDLTTGQCIASCNKTDERYTVTFHVYNNVQVYDTLKGCTANTLTTKRSRKYNSSFTTPESVVVCSHAKSAYSPLYIGDSDRYTNTERMWGKIELFDKTTGKIHMLTGHTDYITTVALCPDKNIMVTNDDMQAKVWHWLTGQCIVLAGHTGRVHASAISSNGRHVVTGSDDTTACVWDIGYLTGQLDFDTLVAYLRAH